MSTRIPQANILPRGMYALTAETFFYTNILWIIRAVDLACYTIRNSQLHYSVADALNQRLWLYCVPMPAERVITLVEQFAHSDDWIDVYLLTGARLRNIQRG